MNLASPARLRVDLRVRHAARLDKKGSVPFSPKLPNLILGGVVAALGIYLIVYVGFTLSSTT